MDLSLGSLSAFNNGASAQGRTSHARGNEFATGGADSAATPATRESATQRPAREAGQTSQLTPEEQAQVRELQKRDREVRAHEAAHRAAAGGLATGGSYTYQTGPDGRNYAVGGEVSISASSSGSPEEKLRQAETIRRAALAPADPSPQDRQVAAQAAAMAAQARSEISAQQRQEQAELSEKTQTGKAQGNTQQIEHAIASFSSVAGTSSLHSNPTPIDEII